MSDDDDAAVVANDFVYTAAPHRHNNNNRLVFVYDVHKMNFKSFSSWISSVERMLLAYMLYKQKYLLFIVVLLLGEEEMLVDIYRSFL